MQMVIRRLSAGSEPFLVFLSCVSKIDEHSFSKCLQVAQELGLDKRCLCLVIRRFSAASEPFSAFSVVLSCVSTVDEQSIF